MPIFEFICQTCGKPFEELVRSAGSALEVTCPECGSPEVKKKISMFASRVSGSGSSWAALSASACSPGSV